MRVDSVDSITKAAAAATDDDDDEYHHAAAIDNVEEEEMERLDNEDYDIYKQHAGEEKIGHGRAKPSRHSAAAQTLNYHSIECLINNDYTVSCRQDSNGEVYLPFKFIRKYFEVSIYGNITEYILGLFLLL